MNNTLINQMTVGEYYKVPCFVLLHEGNLTNNIVPLIDYPHSHPGTEQILPHYHVDKRFFTHDTNLRIYAKEGTYETMDYCGNITVQNEKNNIATTDAGTQIGTVYGKIVDIELRLLHADLTPDFEHKDHCAVNHRGNKCPHLGFDLSRVAADGNGVRTCPMHGLKVKNRV